MLEQTLKLLQLRLFVFAPYAINEKSEMSEKGFFHRGISLNIFSYHLVFLDIFILNIFTISLYCCLSCFLRAANTLNNAKESRKCEGVMERKAEEEREKRELFSLLLRFPLHHSFAFSALLRIGQSIRGS